MSCQYDVVSRRRRANTASCHYDFGRQVRRRVKSAPCQDGVVSTRHRAKNDAVPRRHRFNTTPFQDDAVPILHHVKKAMCQYNTTPCWHDTDLETSFSYSVVLTRHSVVTMSFRHDFLSTRCRFLHDVVLRRRHLDTALLWHGVILRRRRPDTMSYQDDVFLTCRYIDRMSC